MIATDPAGGAQAATRTAARRSELYRRATDELGEDGDDSLVGYLDLGALLALGEQQGLAEDPAYATFAAELRRLQALGLAVERHRAAHTDSGWSLAPPADEPMATAAELRHPTRPRADERRALPDTEYLFTSESVTEGHPDKICDQISDGVLDAVLAGDPVRRASPARRLVNTGLVVVSGEISTRPTSTSRRSPARRSREIGYTDADLGFSPTPAR